MNTDELKQHKQHIRLNLFPAIAITMILSLVFVGVVTAPTLAAPPKTVTISWVEAANRYSYDGTLQDYVSAETIGPLDFLQTGKTYHVLNLADFYSIPVSDIKGTFAISASGNLLAETTYIRGNSPLLLKDHMTGRVTVDPDAGTMTGTYIQYRQAYGFRAEVLAVYPYAIPDKSPNARGWWFLDYTEYVVSSTPSD